MWEIVVPILSSILGGALSTGESDQEKASKEILSTLQENEDWLSGSPFSKEEIMNALLPAVQKIYRGAADVAAGKLGATIGEGDLAGGQAFMEYYTQALGSVIAEGETNAGNAVSTFGKWYSDLDSERKNRFLQTMNLELSAVGGLPTLTNLQKFFTGAIKGADIGTTAMGNISQASAINSQTALLEKLAGQLQNNNQNVFSYPTFDAPQTEDLTKIYG